MPYQLAKAEVYFCKLTPEDFIATRKMLIGK